MSDVISYHALDVLNALLSYHLQEMKEPRRGAGAADETHQLPVEEEKDR